MPTIWKTLGLCAAIVAGAGGEAQAGVLAADNLTDGSLHGVVKFSNALAPQGSFLTPYEIRGLATDGTSVYLSLPYGISKTDQNGTQLEYYENLPDDRFQSLAWGNNTLLAADNPTGGEASGVILFNYGLSYVGNFQTAGPISGLATDGSSIFASLPTGIVEYSFTGAILDTYANVGVDRFGALSFADGVLYAADNLTDNSLSGVVRLNDDLDLLGSFVTTGAIAGLAAGDGSVYASLPTGITRYSSTGTVLSTYANVGVDSFGALALTPDATPGVPEPASWAMLIAGFGLVGVSARRRSRVVQAV